MERYQESGHGDLNAKLKSEIYPEGNSWVSVQEQELKITPRFLGQTMRWIWWGCCTPAAKLGENEFRSGGSKDPEGLGLPIPGIAYSTPILLSLHTSRSTLGFLPSSRPSWLPYPFVLHPIDSTA